MDKNEELEVFKKNNYSIDKTIGKAILFVLVVFVIVGCWIYYETN